MVTCVSCQHEASLFLKTKDYDYRVSDEVFDYYRCPNCGLLFLYPVPPNLGDYYHTDYYQIPHSLEDVKTSAKAIQYGIEIVQEFVSSGQLLDIGPAYGIFAYLAREAGFGVQGIEMDAACCKFMSEVVGVSVIQSDDPISTLQDLGHYDVITMWHVIEHVPDPWTLLTVMAEHLNPGGIMLLAAPNPDALQFRFLGSRWRHLQAPRHLNLFPITLLEERAHALGLRTALITTTDPGSVGLNYVGWYRSFTNFFTAPVPCWIMGVVGRIIHKMLIPIERTGKRGSAYTLVFQKPH